MHELEATERLQKLYDELYNFLFIKGNKALYPEQPDPEKIKELTYSCKLFIIYNIDLLDSEVKQACKNAFYAALNSKDPDDHKLLVEARKTIERRIAELRSEK